MVLQKQQIIFAEQQQYYLHILKISHNCLDLECSWSHRPQITCDSFRIKLFTSKLVLGTFLHCFLPWLVIILNSTPYPRYILYWMATQNTSSATLYLSYELFYTFSLDIHLINLVVTELNCHFSINFDHNSLSFFDALCQLNKCNQHVTILLLLFKIGWILASWKWRKFKCASVIFFSAASVLFQIN